MTSREQSSSILRELLDESREGLLALDENGTIVYGNSAAGAVLGRTKIQLLGKPLATFVPLQERRAFRSALASLEDLPRVSVGVHLADSAEETQLLLRVAGSSKPRRIVATLTQGPAGAVSPVLQRRAISRELDTFFLRFPQAVVGVDRTLRIAFANIRAKAMLGPEMRIGRPFVDAHGEGRLLAIAERLVAIAAPVAAASVPLDDGRVLRVSGVAARGSDPAVLFLEDVTEETRSDRVTRDFVRNAAHQLRTPLTGIASAVQVLQSGAKETPADRDRFLEHVERHTERLIRIARGLLVLARAQANEAMRLEFVELRPLFEELAAEAAPHEGVAIEIDCPAGLAAFCEADLTHEAVSALLDNAVDHTKEGTISLLAWEVDGRVALEVRDTGSGILPEHRERLFEPFYRPAVDGNGFGLGLAIAAQAIEAMDGELLVSDTDRGTRFTIRLPSARVVA